jgi:hypothetical protein
VNHSLLAGLFGVGLYCTSVFASAADVVPASCDHLELVLDPRLTPSVVRREWASGHPRSEMPAVLELRGCAGQLLDHLKLDAPLARLDRTPLRGTLTPTYLLSEDLTAAAGTYSGPLTIPVQIERNHLEPAQAGTLDGHLEPIHLVVTGKAAWKKVRVGAVDDFLSVNCVRRDDGFVIFYRRFHPAGNGWQMHARSEPGFWESDGDFPEAKLFP